MSAIVIEYLVERRDLLPTVQAWFEAEWPTYYGPGGRGSAQHDLRAYANRGSLPVGLVALRRGAPCGFAALKADSLPTHLHLLPWVGAGYVEPSLRRQGIGHELLLALEVEARALGYACIYCATATAVSLLRRSGWHLLEDVQHDGESLSVFEKAL